MQIQEPGQKKVTVIPPTIVIDDTPQKKRQLRTAAYCRVSSDSEDQELSFDAQRDFYTDKIMTNPEWSLAGIFADAAVIIGLKTLRLKKCQKHAAF